MWKHRTVKRDDAVPVWRQVAEHLATDIESGELGPGDRLPSEADLVAAYGVARGTARKAIRHLVDEGIVTVTPGKGAYVNAG